MTATSIADHTKVTESAKAELLNVIFTDIMDIVRFNQLLKLPQYVEITYVPSQAEVPKGWEGGIDVMTGVIFVSLALDFDISVEVFCHELIHCEQMHLGQLSMEIDTERLCWFGVPFEHHSSYEEYTNFPWEIDAFAREKKLVNGVRSLLYREAA